MPNTYSQIYLQLVFATKGRETKIGAAIKDELEKYICGIFRNKGQKVIAIYANHDHIHILFSYKNLQITVPDLVKVVKAESTNFINDSKLLSSRFYWQEGYGVFSYSKSQKDAVTHYILKQAEHHSRKNFREEYHDFCKNLELIMTKNIFLNFMIDKIASLRDASLPRSVDNTDMIPTESQLYLTSIYDQILTS